VPAAGGCKQHQPGGRPARRGLGKGKGNTIFDGAGEDEAFGLAQVSGPASDRYKFRTSPLRNVALQPTFFHNGAFTRLDDAVRHHLDVLASARSYPRPGPAWRAT
jgi:cytochrome c peroxidase